MAEKPTITSKKKRLAPAPPPVELNPMPTEEIKKDFKHFASESQENVSVEKNNLIQNESVPPQGHLSPSGKEAMEILDDLNVMLDENYQQSPSGFYYFLSFDYKLLYFRKPFIVTKFVEFT